MNADIYPFYKKIALLLGPLLFVACVIVGGGDSKLFAVYGSALWMLIWWMAEVVPLYVTALLPMVLFPSLGVFSVSDTFSPYANPIIFLFMGGFVIALAMEERKLHLRIALQIIRFTGTKPQGIILGFMLATAFLSMWISNTATSVMMLPIALSVLHLLKESHRDKDKEFKTFGLALILAIAYSANIGGTMTLIGTPPNVVMAGLIENRYGIEVGFGKWLLMGLPTGMILLGAAYLLLLRTAKTRLLPDLSESAGLIAEKTKALGPMGNAERKVAIIFALTAFLWSFKGNINGLIGSNVLHNTTIAMFGALLAFTVPVDLKRGEFVLHWKDTVKLPWGILLLFGGGLCLAAAFDEVGIISSIGNWVAQNVNTSLVILCLVLTLISLFATEVMSNVALITVFIPVVMGISDGFGLSPFQLTIPVTLAASCAFMMPISTPPNAVVYSSGLIPISKMVRIGFWLNIASGLLIGLVLPELVSIIFG